MLLWKPQFLQQNLIVHVAHEKEFREKSDWLYRFTNYKRVSKKFDKMDLAALKLENIQTPFMQSSSNNGGHHHNMHISNIHSAQQLSNSGDLMDSPKSWASSTASVQSLNEPLILPSPRSLSPREAAAQLSSSNGASNSGGNFAAMHQQQQHQQPQQTIVPPLALGLQQPQQANSGNNNPVVMKPLALQKLALNNLNNQQVQDANNTTPNSAEPEVLSSPRSDTPRKRSGIQKISDFFFGSKGDKSKQQAALISPRFMQPQQPQQQQPQPPQQQQQLAVVASATIPLQQQQPVSQPIAIGAPQNLAFASPSKAMLAPRMRTYSVDAEVYSSSYGSSSRSLNEHGENTISKLSKLSGKGGKKNNKNNDSNELKLSKVIANSLQEMQVTMTNGRYNLQQDKARLYQMFAKVTVDESLNNYELRQILKFFAREEYAEENLVFWEAVKVYHDIPKTASHMDQRVQFAHDLFKTFILETGDMALNINQKLISKCTDMFLTQEMPKMFDMVLDTTILQIADLLERFKMSMYQGQ